MENRCLWHSMRNWFIIFLSLLLEVRKRKKCPSCQSLSIPDGVWDGVDDSGHCEQSPTSRVKLDLTFKIKSTNNRAAAAKSLQSCLTLCNPIDGSPPGSPIPGILQARTLEWVAISFSSAWKWKGKVKSLSRVRLLETPWTATYLASLSRGFSRQEKCTQSQVLQ